MDGILALGHFCETHGPCIVLCTQRSQKEPQQLPHSLTVPWCESCQSIDLKQALVSRDDKSCYVTTRTPLQQDLAFLLKQAAVRSLSCEEVSKDEGTIYFGDNERGHVLSYTFTVQDSLARGFHRKYSVLMLMRDKVHLLNSWPTLTKNIKKLVEEIQAQAAQVNDAEQATKSQRAVRQAQCSPGTSARSLSQLTGQPAIFAQVHMWFTWLLSSETVVEKPHKIPELPVNSCPPNKLKNLSKEMPKHVFRTVCYCILTGIKIHTEVEGVLETLVGVLPKGFLLPTTGEPCELVKNPEGWEVKWRHNLPSKLPSLLVLIEKALQGDLPDSVLEPYLMSLIMQWHNIAWVIRKAPTQSPELLQSLGVHKQDLPLLSYWTCQCRND